MKYLVTRMRRWRLLVAAASVLVLVGCVSGSPLGGEMDAKDAAGLTQAEVKELTLEEEYELYRARYDRAGALLGEAQRQVSGADWVWNGVALPNSGYAGGVRGTQLPGSDGDTSYMVEVSASIQVPGATGQKADLDVMRAFYEAQGWEIQLQEVTGDWRLWGVTPDRYWVEYGIQESGYYFIAVYSELFWTNDEPTLHTAVFEHSPGRPPATLPVGEYERIPPW